MNNDVAAREIAREQEYVDTVYDQLEKASLSAQELAKEGLERGRIGNEGGLVERDAMVFQAARRMATLDAAHEGLVFGRLDLRSELSEVPRYIGRIGLRDANYDVLLIDWRAPAAAVFYQATQADPQGVVRRRILRSKGVKVLGVEDDLLDAEAETDLPIIGEGALLAQLDAGPRPVDALHRRDHPGRAGPRDPRAEQGRRLDHRRPRHRQDRGGAAPCGVPALRRPPPLRDAAACWSSDPRACSCATSSGCCPRSVRPPSRCARSARSSTACARPGATSPAVAEVKGSLAMAEVLRRTARQAVPDAPREFRFFYRDDVIHLGSRELGAIRRQLLSMGRRNRSTTKVASTLIDAMWRQVRGERGRERTKEDFAEEMRTSDEFLEFAAAWWPVLDAATVLGWLRDPEVLARVSEGVLDDESVRLLSKSWGPRKTAGRSPSTTWRCSTSCATCSATRRS